LFQPRSADKPYLPVFAETTLPSDFSYFGPQDMVTIILATASSPEDVASAQS
jgi:hypothetical protein